MPLSLVGNLADLGLGDIFQIVSLSRRSGTLQLTTSLDTGEIIFQQGLVVASYRQGSERVIGEGLLECSLLTPTDYQEMLQSQGQGIVGEALFERFHLKTEATQAALAELLKADVYRMLGWDEGGFSFVLEQNPDRWRGFNLAGTRVVVLEGINPQFLAIEGARIRDESKQPDALEEFLARSRPPTMPEPPRPISTRPRAQRFAEQLGTDSKSLSRLDSSAVPVHADDSDLVGVHEDDLQLVEDPGPSALSFAAAPVMPPAPAQAPAPAAVPAPVVAPSAPAPQPVSFGGAGLVPPPSTITNDPAARAMGGIVPPPASVTRDPAAQRVVGVVPPPASITKDPAAQRVATGLVPPPASITADPAAKGPRGGIVPPPASITQDPAARGFSAPQKERSPDDKVIPFPQGRVRRGPDTQEREVLPAPGASAPAVSAQGSGAPGMSAPAHAAPAPQASWEAQPAAAIPAPAVAAPEVEKAPAVAMPETAATGRYLLVVDDDHELGPLIGQPFAGNFAGLLTATNVKDALEHLRKVGSCTVLAVDLIQPRSDGQGILGGLEVLEAARGWYPNLPAVMFTDYHNVEAEQRAQQLGVARVLVKPRRALMFDPGTHNPSAVMWEFLDALGGALEPHFAPGPAPVQVDGTASGSPGASVPSPAAPVASPAAAAPALVAAPPSAAGLLASPASVTLPSDLGAGSLSVALQHPSSRPVFQTGPVSTGIYDLAKEIADELGEEADLAKQLPPLSPSEGALAELRAMLAELADPANRETVTLLVLRFAADVVDRAGLFLVARTHFVGLGGFSVLEASDEYVRRVRRVKIKRDGGSIFDDVLRYRSLVRVRLNDAPQNRELLSGLSTTPEGSWHGNEVIAVPLISADRVAAILFGDNPGGKELGRTDALEIFMQQAGLAMDRVLLERQLEEARRRSQS